jgi:hypothetical protein
VSAQELPFMRLPAGPSNRQGPEGRPLNVSPARKGWDIDRNEDPERRGRGTMHAYGPILDSWWDEAGAPTAPNDTGTSGPKFSTAPTALNSFSGLIPSPAGLG